MEGKTPSVCRHRHACVQWSRVSSAAIVENHINADLGIFFSSLFIYCECSLMCSRSIVQIKNYNSSTQEIKNHFKHPGKPLFTKVVFHVTTATGSV